MNDRDDTRWIRKDEQRKGPFTVQQLYRMVNRGEIDNQTLFWSERRQHWLRLVRLLDDLYPTSENLDQMRQAGIKRVKVIGRGPGWEDRTCDACRKLIDRTFPIDAAPELPPEGCNCTPWCGSLIIALADDDSAS
jgi:hypothetical protein